MTLTVQEILNNGRLASFFCNVSRLTDNREKNVNVHINLILDCQAVSILFLKIVFCFFILHFLPSPQTFCLTRP